MENLAYHAVDNGIAPPDHPVAVEEKGVNAVQQRGPR